MENFEEFLNQQKQAIESAKLRLEIRTREYANINKDVLLNNKDKINNETENNILNNQGKLDCIENYTGHNDDLNDLTKGILELPQLSSSNKQFDPNSNGIKNPDNSNDSNNNEKEQIMENSSFLGEKIEKKVSTNMKSVEFFKENYENNNIEDKVRNVSNQNNWIRRRNNDMEQWISDTFYSYFPSLNSEHTKRENNRARQLDYQNYLKKISNDNDQETEKYKKNDRQSTDNATTARPTDKSEMEIIVTTNPNFESHSKYRNSSFNSSPRPSSTRDKLLQDLKHTELSNIIYGDAIQMRKQVEIEREMQKKKEYQKDLMRQIEEKRREIELLKEKERIDDENLTRKLEEQLRTVKLQEELEKEKIKAERTRFEIERNKIIREQLFSKLEEDKMLVKSPESNSRETKSENDKESLLESEVRKKDINEVYRFFTNSARQEYRKPHNLSLTDTFDEFAKKNIENDILEQPNFVERQTSSNILLKDCVHLRSKNCPFCEIKLKNYESWCPHCKQQILDDGAENRTMICENCENQYLICSACNKNKVVCLFCHRKRNICVQCTRNFCVHCGNSMLKCKSKKIKGNLLKNRSYSPKASPSEHSFQILELPHSKNNGTPINGYAHSSFSLSPDNSIKFSTNYSKTISNSENHNSDSEFFQFGVKNGEIIINNKIYKDKNKRNLNEKISNFKNSSEKTTYNNKNEKKINNTNVSLNEIPLLSEIQRKSNLKNKKEPKLYNQKIFRDTKSNNSSIEDLSRKWEIPAVEKRTISVHSPIVLTQVGAVRRQLQMDRLQAEFL